MSDPLRPSRPVHENIRLQHIYWIAERAGWCLLALIVVLALLGVFSRGILSDATARRDGLALTINYERFQRVTALTRFKVTIEDARQDEVRLRLSPAFQNTYEIDTILPRSTRSSAGSDGVDMFFDPPDSGTLTITMWLRPRDFGPLPLEFGTVGGSLQLSVFIYP